MAKGHRDRSGALQSQMRGRNSGYRVGIASWRHGSRSLVDRASLEAVSSRSPIVPYASTALQTTAWSTIHYINFIELE